MTAISQSVLKLRKACADVFSVRNSLTIAEVVEKHFKLSAETEGDPGSYDIENNPYWRKVINSCDDPDVRRIAVIKSTQVGGTILTHGIMFACAVVDPAPSMYVTPTRDEFKIQRDRIIGNGLASNKIISDLMPSKHRTNMEVIQLGAMKVNAAWAGSPQRLRGKPCKRIWKNETDVYAYKGAAGNPHNAADERVKQFQFNYLIFDESTPVGDESHIYSEWDSSNQERWHVQCPHCDHWQELRFFPFKAGRYAGCGGFAGYRNAPTVKNGRVVQGTLLDPAEAEANAYYICEHGCFIEQEYKNSMIRGGMWSPKGCKIERTEQPVGPDQTWAWSPCGKYKLAGKPKRNRERSGFHVWTVMQSKISVGKIAAAFVQHVNDGKIRDFFQNWLGWRYRIGQRVPAWNVIAKKYSRGYHAGTVPDKAWFLTAAADVQEDLVYWMVCAWGPMGTCYLIGWGEIYKHEVDNSEQGEGIILASDLAELPAAMMYQDWPVNGVNPMGKQSLRVRLSGVDSNYRVAEVHQLAQSIGNEKVFRCLRGDDAVKDQLYRRSEIKQNKRTKVEYPGGGLIQYQIYKTHFQDLIAEQLLAAPNQPGALHLPVDIMPAGKKLLRQIANVRKNDKGFYTTKDDGLGKDYRDVLGYNRAMAEMVVDDVIGGKNKWSEKAWTENLIQNSRKASRKKTNTNKKRDLAESME